MKDGWICPKCGKVLAPFIPSCDCYKQYRNEQTIQPRIFGSVKVWDLYSYDERYRKLKDTDDNLDDNLQFIYSSNLNNYSSTPKNGHFCK